MSTPSLRDRYLELIDQIVQTTLKGNIRSKEQVYQMLLKGIEAGTGEVFEYCLQERVDSTQQQTNQADEFKQAKATRSLRALQTIQGEWQRWQTQNQATSAIVTVLNQITTAEPRQRLTVFVQAIDPNRADCLNGTQLKQLAKALQSNSSLDDTLQQDSQCLAAGITRGLETWSRLQDHLIGWIYEPSAIGFENAAGQQSPWAEWGKHITSPVLLALCRTIVAQESVAEFAAQLPSLDLSDWVELAIVLQYLQQGLIGWADQQIYSTKLGAKFSISTFLMFPILWSQLARGFEQSTLLNSFNRDRFANGCFQIAIQILRVFSQRSYFPLYGNVFSSFPGGRLRSVVDYLNEPLRRVEGTQEKARILTLIGSSTRAQGLLEEAKGFHQIAREAAAAAGDRPCEIANLNHLSRTAAAQKNYAEAVSYSQRALIISRQVGDRPGEANALVNLGYGEVLLAQQREQAEPEVYESAIDYLRQGLNLAERENDRQSQALGFNSLGIAYLAIDQAQEAIASLSSSLKAAQTAGDLYLQGLNLAYTAEAYYRLGQRDTAIYAGCVGMYYLELIASREWRQPAGLLTVLQGQMGDEFQKTLEGLRRDLLAGIGVDGYDHIPKLLEQYRNGE
ncbi:MAG TPA: tetratricopeptide repeat protein [Thermosynechococcaceae cyanobacterium]